MLALRDWLRLPLVAIASLFLALPALAQQPPAGSILWLKGDGSTVTTAGKVSLWRDASGLRNDARQTIGSEQPTLVQQAVKGLPVVRFNGANHLVAASVFPVHEDYSLTFVVRINNLAATNNIVSGNSHAHWLGGNAYPKVLHSANFQTQAISEVAINSGFNVVTMTYLESRQRVVIYVNGVFADSAVTGPNIDSVIYLGAFAAQNYMNGDLAEVILYRRELSQAERMQLEGYLIDKYAITVPRPYAPPAAGPLLWLKADSGVVATNGIVSNWLDRSGNGYAARQDTLTLQPTLLPNATYNLPAVRFNGLGAFMEASSVFPTNADYSLLFVVRINNLGATNNVVSGNNHAHWFGQNQYAKVLHGNFSAQATSTIPIVQSEFTIVTMTYLEARQQATIYINSHLADSAVVGSNPDSTIFLGAFAKGNVMNGDLAEVILYRRELSPLDRAITEEYLFRKYGIVRPPPPPPPDSTFAEVPKTGQLYARGANDSATVPILGAIQSVGFDSIYVSIVRNNKLWKRVAAPLVYKNGVAAFDLQPTIHAELSEYRFSIGIKSVTIDSLIAERDSVVCGDVFLIDGQSNTIFGGTALTYEYCRTFGKNYSSNPRDTLWGIAQADGSGGGPHIGAWGIRMGGLLIDQAQVPICIINGGVGGTSVQQHQRNDLNPTDLATIYGSMLYRVRKSGLAEKAKALLWYQGESNSIANYYTNFHALQEDWRIDYPNLKKFYVVQIRPGCGGPGHLQLRELLRTLPDSLANFESVSVMGIAGHDGCHYLGLGYDTIGVQLYRLVARDFYNAADSIDISSPSIWRAYYTDSSHTRIALLFTNARQGMVATSDTIIAGALRSFKDAFFLDDSTDIVQSVEARGDTVFLRLSVSRIATTITYIPDQTYPGTGVVYEGPWLTNKRGVGAFSFYRYPITTAPPPSSVDDPHNLASDATKGGATVTPNPFSTRTELRTTVAHAGRIRIMLYDILGREVRRQTVDARAGENTITIEREGLTTGQYLCKIIGVEGEHVISIVVR